MKRPLTFPLLLLILGCADAEPKPEAPPAPAWEPDAIATEHVDSILGVPGVHTEIFIEQTGTNGGTGITIVDGKVTIDGDTSDWRVILNEGADYVYAERVNGKSVVHHTDDYEKKQLAEIVEKPKSDYARPLSDFLVR